MAWRLLQCESIALSVVLALVIPLLSGERYVHASSPACAPPGFYSLGDVTSQPCPEILPCEPGFYCTDGQRRPCLAGSYGDNTQLRTEACSGPCPAGFYCPEGTVSPLLCGGDHLYCPLGSSAPANVPPGYASIGVAPRRRHQIRPCAPGWYCSQGHALPCPAGTYGDQARLTSSACSAPCPAGYYCPRASVTPVPCSAGTFGSRTGETSAECSGVCPAGYYCPAGTIAATSWPCGAGGVYCPIGSTKPRRVEPGYYVPTGHAHVVSRQLPCPRGSYCPGNLEGDDDASGGALPCPPGTFGEDTGLHTSMCSGLCSPGYYCPQGSTSDKAQPCGGIDVYCPRGSATPTPVTSGYYTYALRDDQEGGHHAQRKCEPGHYCLGGLKKKCPAGSYGIAFALTTPQCSGECQAGFYCPEGSTVAQAKRCGASDWFCPSGSSTPTRVTKGYCTVDTTDTTSKFTVETRTAQRLARTGEFAWDGVCYDCPAGHYGANEGETRATCTGTCLAGYYCPAGSTSATAIECGGAHVYCPTGAAQPLPVDTGYYTTTRGMDESTCPPGTFRDPTTTTSHFLDLVTQRTPIAVSYGDTLYPLAGCMPCPEGTFKPGPGDAPGLCQPCPQFVATSTLNRRSCQCFRLPGGPAFDLSITHARLRFTGTTCELQEPTEPRHLTGQWDAAPTEAAGTVVTRTQQWPCERGFTCLDGIRMPCPGGTYGDLEKETRANCAGPCSPGFYCPLASINSSALRCGGASVYCPQGSATPIPVSTGYFTIRAVGTSRVTHLDGASRVVVANTSATESIRDTQQQCAAGYYCQSGRAFICPPGRFGNQQGETSELCTGLCKRGHYCPAGSVTPTALRCGGNNVVCRTGAWQPSRVPRGYYSIGGGSALTRFHSQPCERGHYCVDGVKRACPPGTYGATIAISSPQCSGLCAAGYRCPSAPPLIPPSTSEIEVVCGANASVYCPPGTGNVPRFVTNGYYSISSVGHDGIVDLATGDTANTTRVAQLVCPRGYYCREGLRIRCPPGTYGDQERLTSTQCRGWCPAGFFCPPATIEFQRHPCPPGTYAPRGSAVCMPCNPTGTNLGGGYGNKSEKSTLMSSPEWLARFHLSNHDGYRCTHARECCFAG